MVEGIVSSALQSTARNASADRAAATSATQPNVAQTVAGEEFPPTGASLVFTPATQGRFARMDSFLAVAQSSSDNTAAFDVSPTTPGNRIAAAQDLNPQLDTIIAGED
jgi:hypothetical protein